MISKANIKQGDLYLINFDPSIGHEYQGKRPALIIQANTQIRKSNLITVMPLTSNCGNCLTDDIVIKKDSANRLISNSVIKVYSIISFDYKRLVNKIGTVDDFTLGKVKSYLQKHFKI
ncbi:MAG: type II toxin-antitoxin system PemK/MazF family toxin [Patescibacteria group bacterium]|nr:type II toxin-antitoxin system PemK/MazF family toxin [Patescibacteria group bacterium]